MAESDPRRLAFNILWRVDQEGAYSSVLLQQIRSEDLPPRDRGLVTELVYGVIRWRLYLDHVIAKFSSRPLDDVDPDVRLVLRIALYQILFLTRIPDHAAVNEAVEMARRRMREGAASAVSFVNALLRTVLRERARVPAPPAPREGEDPAPALAIAHSHPEWLVRRWLNQLGVEEATRLLEAQNRPASVAIRVTSRAASREGVAAALSAESVATRPSRYLDDFLVAVEGAPQHTGAFRLGEIYIQDEASGLVARLAGASCGQMILDACAAPGGKALSLAERVGPGGLVVAGDLHPSRLRLLRENAARLGLPSCAAVAADFADREAPFAPGALFDAVMVDAPCSGTGVIRRNPELRYRLSPGSLKQLAALQARLLDRCARLVRPGGTLIYSVCSLEPEEGVDQVRRFQREHRAFVLADVRSQLPESARGLVARDDGGSFFVTLPHRDELDGFVAARLSRQR